MPKQSDKDLERDVARQLTALVRQANREAAQMLPWNSGESWRRAAACQGMDRVFLPTDGEFRPDSRRNQWQRALRMCQGCAVTKPCLDWAIESGELSTVAGGFTPPELRAAAKLGTLTRSV